MYCKTGKFISTGSGDQILDTDIKEDTGVIQKLISSVEPQPDRQGRYIYYPLPDNKTMNSEPFKSIWELVAGLSVSSPYSEAGIYTYPNLFGVYKFQFYGAWTLRTNKNFFYIQEDSPYYNVDVLFNVMKDNPILQNKVRKHIDMFTYN